MMDILKKQGKAVSSVPPKRFKFWHYLFLAASILFSLPASNAHSAQVTLAWDASTDSNTAGYKVYSGTSSRSYQAVIDVGKTTTCTISNLPDGTNYYFAATDYNASGAESAYSNEVFIPTSATCTYSISPTSQSPGSSGGTGTVSVTAPSGCSWTAISNASWITVTSNGNVTGNATVNYSVSDNSGTTSRTGTITIAGKIFTATQSGSSQNTSTGKVVGALNAGGAQYSSNTGTTYVADKYYSGGSIYGTTAAIAGTADAILYQSERYGNFSYSIPVANGNYTVTLKFAEIYWSSAGQRIFNVNIGGTQVVSNLDIFAMVGQNRAYDVAIPVTVVNGTLKIDFVTVVDNAKVSAILIQTSTLTTYTITASAGSNGSISPPGTVTLNSGANQTFIITPNTGYQISDVKVDGTSAGATSSYTFGNVMSNHTIQATFSPGGSSAGKVVGALNAGGAQYSSNTGTTYVADKYYSGGSIYGTTAAIAGTADAILYQSERYGNFSYSISVANGNYTVTLKFAEIYWSSAGQRIFNVNIGGTQVVSNLDIFGMVGQNRAYDVAIPVTVVNGTLKIDFVTVVDNAKVSAILVQTR